MKKPRLDGPTHATVDNYSPRRLRGLLRLALAEPDPEPVSTDTASSRALARVLSDDVTLDELREFKTYAKGLLKEAPVGPPRDAAKLLYHLAVAQAGNRFGVSISRVAARNRLGLYQGLAAAFAGHPMGDVFADAVRYLHEG